jgi:hypothetical protein
MYGRATQRPSIGPAGLTSHAYTNCSGCRPNDEDLSFFPTNEDLFLPQRRGPVAGDPGVRRDSGLFNFRLRYP